MEALPSRSRCRLHFGRALPGLLRRCDLAPFAICAFAFFPFASPLSQILLPFGRQLP